MLAVIPSPSTPTRPRPLPPFLSRTFVLHALGKLFLKYALQARRHVPVLASVLSIEWREFDRDEYACMHG